MSTLDNFKREAKRWLKALRAGDAAARARLARVYSEAPAEPALRDVQHALARENDAESWSALKNRLAREPQSEAETPLRLLLHAADRGDVPAVIAVADRHPDLVSARGTLPGHTGLRTALHFGVHHRDVVAALLDRGADPNIRDEGDNAMPLHFACERNDLDTIRLLIEHGADPIGTGDGHDLDIIGWACVFGQARPDIVEYLLAHGSRHNILSAVATGAVAAIEPIVVADPAQLDRTMDATNLRRKPVHLAIVKRQPDALAALIRFGADIDAVDAAGLTALDQAALDGETAMAALLVDSGATIQLPAAIVLNRTDDIERLLRESPDALRPGGAWARVIIRASEKGSAETIEMLIRHGASVDVRDDTGTSIDGTSGYTALHAAAWNGNREAVDALLRHGANPCVRDGKYCATPAGWADYAGHPAVRDAILRGPIDLFDAIHFNRPDLIPGILARDPAALSRPFAEYADCGGEDEGDPRPTTTPLEWAVIRNNVEAARLLASWAAPRSATPEIARRVRELAGAYGVVMATFPDWFEPMAATLTQERFAGPEWLFERKLDGIRVMAFKRGNEVRLFSRNRLPLDSSYPAVAAAIAKLPARDLILDGEATGAWGRMGRADYHVFDILWIDGRDVRSLPLVERRALLAELPLHGSLAHVPEIDAPNPWELAKREGWEGVIAKRRDSHYEHRRSPHWIKMKCEESQELVVGGFTDPQGKRVGLGALLVGYYDGDDLCFAGKIGTGFDNKLLLQLRAELDALEVPKTPFTKARGLPRLRAHWVRPEIVVQVAFIEWTGHGKLRHPRLLGVRRDKRARDVVRESA